MSAPNPLLQETVSQRRFAPPLAAPLEVQAMLSLPAPAPVPLFFIAVSVLLALALSGCAGMLTRDPIRINGKRIRD
ncbi:MAG: hypothetical protein ACRED0_04690 [Gammaproteobacteria bacterium]